MEEIHGAMPAQARDQVYVLLLLLLHTHLIAQRQVHVYTCIVVYTVHIQWLYTMYTVAL